MTALVRIALQRPYTFLVLALIILIAGPLAVLRTPIDIFPEIRIPVIAVIWQYTGLQPDQMSGRIATPFQRALTTTVNDIEHIEANSYVGVGIIKVFFQSNVGYSYRQCPGHGGLPDFAETVAARHHAAADPELQRLDCADHPAGVVRPGHVRTGAC